MLRVKIFNKKEKKVYSCLIINFFDNSVDILDGESSKTLDFRDVEFLESTGMKAGKHFIYRNDFVIAKKDDLKYKGIIKRYKDGSYYIENKNPNLMVDIKGLIEDNFKIINLGNYGIYFEKLKAKRVEK